MQADVWGSISNQRVATHITGGNFAQSSLGVHFVWAFNLMFLFSCHSCWQELIESIVRAHNKLKVAPASQPRALSIVQGCGAGVSLGGIATTWAFYLAKTIASFNFNCIYQNGVPSLSRETHKM
ncbi:hypothetical protein AMTRI_Chr10g230770 [Amborella trichopoda]